MLVLCLHLLTTQGTWSVSDQAEMIYTARRLLTARSFDFAPAGESVPGMRWLVGEPGLPLRPRLFPGTPIAFLPFVAIDHALGLDRNADLGFFVHFAGHVFLAGALALLGLTLRREGASDRAAIAAILITGTLWPIWQISRRVGAEPLLCLLLAGFLAARRFRPRAAIAAVLPWCHPTGSLLAPLLAASDAVVPGFFDKDASGRRPRAREAMILLACAASGTLGVAIVWNGLYHGHLFGGGYQLYNAKSAILGAPPLDVAAYYMKMSLLYAPVLLLLGIGGALQGGRAGLRLLALPVALLAAFLTLFSLYTTPSAVEPARRLSVVWFALAFTLGRTFDGLKLSRVAALGLVCLSMLNGVYWYRLTEADYYAWGGDGGWEPLVLWITLALEARPFWWSAAPLALLSALACYAAFRTLGGFLAEPTTTPR